MENNNRNDIYNFFKDMPQSLQIEAIDKMKKQTKKPPNRKNESAFSTSSKHNFLTKSNDC